MNFNKFIRRASDFGVNVYAMNDDETKFRFATKWEIPCEMEKSDDTWVGTLFSRSPFVRDIIVKGNKKVVAEKCLEFCVLGVYNEQFTG